MSLSGRQAGWQAGYARVIQADFHIADTLNCFLIIAPIYPFKRNYCTSVATSVARLGLSTRGGVAWGRKVEQLQLFLEYTSIIFL